MILDFFASLGYFSSTSWGVISSSLLIGGAVVFLNVGDIFDAVNGNCFGARVCTFEGVIDGDSNIADTGDETILIDDTGDETVLIDDTGDETILIDDTGDKTLLIDDPNDNSLDVDDIECRNGNPVAGEVLAMGADIGDIG